MLNLIRKLGKKESQDRSINIDRVLEVLYETRQCGECNCISKSWNVTESSIRETSSKAFIPSFGSIEGFGTWRGLKTWEQFSSRSLHFHPTIQISNAIQKDHSESNAINLDETVSLIVQNSVSNFSEENSLQTKGNVTNSESFQAYLSDKLKDFESQRVNVFEVFKNLKNKTLFWYFLSWWKNQENSEIPHHFYDSIIEMSWKESSDGFLEEFVEKLESEDWNIQIGSYNKLLSRFGKEKKFDVLEKLWRRIKSKERIPTPITLCILLSSYKQKNITEVERIWKEFEICGIKPSLVAINIMISAYGKARNLEKAENIFSWAKVNGYIPDIFTFNSLIDASGKSGQIEKAEKYLREMEEAQIVPDQIALGTMIDLYLKFGEEEKAFSIAERMEKMGLLPDFRLQHIFLDYYVKKGDLKGGKRLFSSLKSSGKVPSLAKSKEENLYLHNSMLQLYGKARNPELALREFNEMIENGIIPNQITYNIIIKICGDGGLWEDAEKIFLEMVERGSNPESFVLSTMISIYGKWKGPEEALNFFHQQVKNGVKPGISSLNTLLTAHFDNGEFEKGFQIINELSNLGVKPDITTYCFLLHTYLELMDTNFNGVFLEMMEKANQTVHHQIVKPILENEGKSQSNEAFREELVKFLKQLSDRKLIEQKIIQDSLLRFLVRLRCIEKAEILWELLRARWKGIIPKKKQRDWVLDLHGTSKESSQVILTVELKRLSEKNERMPFNVKVITGRGKKSRIRWFSQVKMSVENNLKAMNLPFREEIGNPGCFVIPGESLIKCLKKKV